MASYRQQSSASSDRLDEAVVNYLEAVENGQTVDPQEWLDRYPDLTTELRNFFADQERVNRWTEPLREVTAAFQDDCDPCLTLAAKPGIPFFPGGLRDYEIVEEIARGGMGIVFKARQLSLNRFVALKMILIHSDFSKSDIQRFRLETEAVASLDHPNIMPVYEVGEYRGRPYFSMKLIEGGDLAARRPLYCNDQRATARLMVDVARGVHHAHQRGILHRDLKPANILIDVKGQPYVTDFGLARRVEEDSGLTLSGAIVGTPSYMAPEQAAGRRDLSTAVDVYSLGAILYTMLTDRPPFRADTPLETVREVLECEPTRPRLLKRGVDRDLEIICLKCLEKQPPRRYASAEALADDLDRWLKGEPIRARSNPIWERALKKARRNPAAAASYGLGAVTLLGLVLGGVFFQDQRARIAERSLREQKQLNEATRLIHDHLAAADVCLATGEVQQWQDAKVLLVRAIEASRQQPALAVLHTRAVNRLAEAEQLLQQDQARQNAAARFIQFMKHRDDVLYHGTMQIGVNLPTTLEATRQASDRALRLAGLTVDGDGLPAFDALFPPEHGREVQAGCYEILTLLAEVSAQQRPPDYDLALRQLDRAQSLGLATQTVHHRRARYLDLLGRTGEAAEARQAATRTKPTGALDHFLLGVDGAQQQDRLTAIDEFGLALQVAPDHFWARYLLAAVLVASKPELAEAHLSVCLNARESASVYFLRGVANRELARFSAAESDLEQALQLANQDVSGEDELRYAVLVARGVARRRQHRLAEAIADCTAAIALKPDWHQAYAERAYVQQQQKQFDVAGADMVAAVERATTRRAAGLLEPSELAKLYLNSARLNLERRDLSGALRDLEQSRLLRPFAEASFQLGQFAYRQRDFHRAMASFDEALTSTAADPAGLGVSEVHRWRARTLLELGDYDQARDSLDGYVLAGGKPDAEIHRLRGLIRAKADDLAGALSDYHRAWELQPDDPLTLIARGWLYAVRNALDLARSDFERAIELEPANSDAQIGLGYVLVLQRQIKPAIEQVTRGIQSATEPLTPRLLYTSARVYSLAVTILDAQPRRLTPMELMTRKEYLDQSVSMLRQALELVPEPNRLAFWNDAVRADYAGPKDALWPLRNESGFRELQNRYDRRVERSPGP